MPRLYDAQGNSLPEDVLVDPHDFYDMLPSIAFANLLKVWVGLDAAQCQKALPDLVLVGQLNANGQQLVININGKSYKVIAKNSRKRHCTLPERCLIGRRNGKPYDENYWILNPGASGKVRYVVTTDRRRLEAVCNAQARALCSNPRYAIHGYSIK